MSDQIRTAQSSGDYAKAAELYLQLIAAGTDTPEVRSNCGVMFHLAGKDREALDQFQNALRRNPGLTAANLFAGMSELSLNQPKQALPYLLRAHELAPHRAEPALTLGKAYVALRDYRSANKYYSEAATLDANSAEAWYGLGVTDRSLAEEILNQAARTGGNSATNQRKVQELLNSALKALTRAVELDPNSARTHLIMAESLSDSGKYTQAATEYQTVMKLDPKLDAAYLGLASQYWKQRLFDEAMPLLKHVLADSPNDPEANGILADIFEHAGDYENARKHAELALAGNPDLIETRVVLARVYFAQKKERLAVSELLKVLPADPDGTYHYLLYRVYRQMGDKQNAEITLAQFQKIRHSSTKN